MNSYTFSRVCTLLALATLVVGVSGCASAPVQEMSNARQTIRAARDAGAETVAPEQLNQAQDLLLRAEGSLKRREFRRAKRAAVEAHGKAAEALQATQPSTADVGLETT
jgi:hypothetical protein